MFEIEYWQNLFLHKKNMKEILKKVCCWFSYWWEQNKDKMEIFVKYNYFS